MDYINDNIVAHFFTPDFGIFCGLMLFFHFIGKNFVEAYCEKYKIKSDVNINNTIYFLMHFFFNCYCVIYNWGNVSRIINNPYDIHHVSNKLSFYMVLFHIYHTIFCWNGIPIDEKFHHIVLVYMLNPLMWLHYTNLCDFSFFFMSGLPGGITYFLLFLKNLKIIGSLTEKFISKHLNLWIRAPGSVITAYIVYLNFGHFLFDSSSLAIKIAVVISVIGSLWNGMHFQSTIVTSYAKHKSSRNHVHHAHHAHHKRDNDCHFENHTHVSQIQQSQFPPLCSSSSLFDTAHLHTD